MKNKLIITIIVLISIFSFSKAVKAADTVSEGWTVGLNCPDGYEDPQTHNAKWGIQTSSDSDRDYNYQQLTAKNVCIHSVVVDSIADVDMVLDNSYIYYCRGDLILGLDNTIPGYTTRNRSGLIGSGIEGVGKMCCPPTYQYIRWTWGTVANYACCSVDPNTLTRSDFDHWRGNVCGKDSNGQDVVGMDAYPIESTEINQLKLGVNTDFVIGTGVKYTCPSDYCFVNSGQLNFSDSGFVVENKLGYQCLSFYKEESDPKDYCIDGKKVTETEYSEFIKVGVSATNACNDFADPIEKETCLACYNTCPTPGTCQYSGAGCIPVTSNDLIIRIFQIGLGVVGAFAIVRFIQAALLRQTADPSKIQESYDIITSIIIGLVVLLGSVVILKFIGVDVLQILPTDFLK